MEKKGSGGVFSKNVHIDLTEGTNVGAMPNRQWFSLPFI